MFFLTVLVVNVVLVIILIINYNKLTTGICKSSRHLVGKVVIVTGANTGIGFATAKDLAERGARVILACRSIAKGTAATESIIASTGNNDVHYKHLDLSSLTSVRAFANGVIITEKRIDILINNAGIYEYEYVRTEDGLLLAMQTNHFGPFLLTSLLLPLLKSSAPSRIINVSSIAHRFGKIDFDNLNNEKDTVETYKKGDVYNKTKVCNVLMTLELARRLKGSGVTVNSLHPGLVATDIVNVKATWVLLLTPLIKLFIKTPWEGAQTSIYTAVSAEVEGVTGKYFSDCREATIAKLALDKDVAQKLWEVSEKLVCLIK